MTARQRTFAGLLAAVLAAASAAGSAHAAATCTVLASAMNFGLYDTLAANAHDTTATVRVSCVPGVGGALVTPYVLTVAGTGSGGDTVRSVSFGSQRLYYQVYADAARSTVWGNGSSSGPGVASSVTSATVATPGEQTHVAYARLAARQAVQPGLYSGSLLVTIDY